MGKNDILKKLWSYKFDLGLLQKISCSTEENKAYKKLIKDGKSLPEGIHQYETDRGQGMGEFYTIYEPDLTEQKINEYLTYKKLKILNTIKNCALSLTVITIVLLIVLVFFCF